MASRGVRIAVEGCGHGTLNAIYASVAESCKQRDWDSVDLVIIGGDFQACRNAADLFLMSCPVKYRQMGDFWRYYSGQAKAPYLTIFIGGNHEAPAHLAELYYGGWVAPNIYYIGAANVLQFGPVRIAGMSGIWKGFDYNKPHKERLPFDADDVKSFYHVREVDVRKLLLLQTQVDVALSHDWPRAIENHGDAEWLFKRKPDFRRESHDGTLGSVAAAYVLERLRPRYWFSAHMHIKFEAIKTWKDDKDTDATQPMPIEQQEAPGEGGEANPDEIDLDMEAEEEGAADSNQVSEELRAKLPASFAAPQRQPKKQVAISSPAGVTNEETRFLALDKCLPGRHFLQLCEVHPDTTTQDAAVQEQTPFRLQYDKEWLAISRVFHKDLVFGDQNAKNPPDLGEETYIPLIQAEMEWVEKNIIATGKLDVPENFEQTASPHKEGDEEIVEVQPDEFTNPQTARFCELLDVPNLWDASFEEGEVLEEAEEAEEAEEGVDLVGEGGVAEVEGEGKEADGSQAPQGFIYPVRSWRPSTAMAQFLTTVNQRTKNQFRPRTGKGGATSYQLRQYAEVTLGGGSLRKVVKLPEGEDENEWLAVNMVDFYNQINLLYGAITEFCSPQSCPEMKATDEFEYLWQDSENYKKPTKMAAPAYIEQLMTWVQSSIDNEQVLPSKIGVPFPKSFPTLVRQIFKRMYRVYAHIYCHHYPVIRELGLEPHLNTSFKQYVLFIDEHSLASGRDYWGPLGDLVDSMLKSD